MKVKLISIILSVCVVLSTFVIINTNMVKAEGETVVIWLFGDSHVGNGVMPGGEQAILQDAVDDTNAMSGDDEVDYAWCVGDMVSNAGHWDEFIIPWNSLDVTTYKNITIGNHDFNWDDDSYSPWYGLTQGATDGDLWYSVDIGNIRICIGGDERTIFGNYNGHGECFMYGGAQRNWFNTTIQNASNNNMNTWIIFHQPLTDTVDKSDEHDYFPMTETNSTYDGSPLFVQMLEYLETNTMSPTLQISAHTHVSVTENTSTQLQLVEKFGVNHLNIGSLTGNGGTPNMHDPCSRYLYLTDGSTTVTIKSYNHSNNSFVDSREYTIELEHAFDFDNTSTETSAPVFQNINNQSNNTVLSDYNRTFNWSVVNDTTYYNLQISNFSNFSNTFLNLNDINLTNYGSTNFTIKGGYVEFILPSQYDIQWNGNHYYRIRAFCKS